MRHVTALIALTALAACSDNPGEDSAAPAAATTAAPAASLFQSEIVPLLAGSCATCHLTGQEAGNMSLVPDKILATLVDVPAVGAPGLKRVVPGDPDASYLVMKLEGTHMQHGGAGAQMPFGAAPLAADKIAKIRQWIKEGAKP